MTFGEKFTKLRKEKGYTQEEVAEILGVSRQAISKWESDQAYPETEKLIKIGELFGCSMDYLLKESVQKEDNQEVQAQTEAINLKNVYFERKSKITVGGLPLWHVNIGFGRTATGIFAFGLCAKGIVSVGIFSLGIVSFGLFALGILAFGSLALGLFASGAISVGIISLGAVSVGILSVGACSIGQISVGALAIGKYFAMGDNAQAMIAIGMSEAVGTLYQAAAITLENRQEVFNLLDQTIPPVLTWAKALIMPFL